MAEVFYRKFKFIFLLLMRGITALLVTPDLFIAKNFGDKTSLIKNGEISRIDKISIN